jgi:hypothetical protein
MRGAMPGGFIPGGIRAGLLDAGHWREQPLSLGGGTEMQPRNL